MNNKKIFVKSPNVVHSDSHIYALCSYTRNNVGETADALELAPAKTEYVFETAIKTPRTGLLLVGLGGSNGTTVVAGVLANKLGLTWPTKEGEAAANYLGSVTQMATLKVGVDAQSGRERFARFRDVLPLVDPNELVISGWDICGDNLAEGMRKAKVIDINLQTQLAPVLEKITPLPSIYYKDFIAPNQADRANNTLPGHRPCAEHLSQLRADIRLFRKQNGLGAVVVLWTANTERFAAPSAVHETEEAFLAALAAGHSEIAPSAVFAMAAVLEGCAFVNGSPQNTLLPAVVKAARRMGVFVAGDDFKSGQTKLKSVLADFLVSAGMRPESVVSYNHLGNNDGKNLSSAVQFESKRVSKSGVFEDVVMKPEPLGPDHCVVIKYVPFVGDSKRAMDEYISSIFLNGRNTIVLHNTCEDSLLAAPIILDLAILTEFFQRFRYAVLSPSQKENEIGEKGAENKKDLTKDSKHREKMVENGRKPAENGEALESCENGRHLPEIDGGVAGDEPALARLLKRRMAGGAAGLRFRRMEPVLSMLAYLLKAPKVPDGEPVVNVLFRQRACLENIFRACVGLEPESNMLLEHKCPE